MSKVFVLDTNKQPLNPIHSGRARMLLSQGKAAVFRRYPFTVILNKEVVNPKVESLRVFARKVEQNLCLLWRKRHAS